MIHDPNDRSDADSNDVNNNDDSPIDTVEAEQTLETEPLLNSDRETDSADTAAEPNSDFEDDYIEAEILPPLKTSPPKGIGVKSLFTATILAAIFGAAGGFGLSYILLPKLKPVADMTGVDAQMQTLSQDTQSQAARLDRLQNDLKQTRALIKTNPLEKTNLLGDADALALMKRLEALENTQNITSENGTAALIVKADPETFMYGDRLLRDIFQEIIETQITLQNGLEKDNQMGTSRKNSLDNDKALQSDLDKSRDSNAASTWSQTRENSKVTDTKGLENMENSQNPKKSEIKTRSENKRSSGAVIGALTKEAKTQVPTTQTAESQSPEAVQTSGKKDTRTDSEKETREDTQKNDGQKNDGQKNGGKDRGANTGVEAGLSIKDLMNNDAVVNEEGRIDRGTPTYIKSRPPQTIPTNTIPAQTPPPLTVPTNIDQDKDMDTGTNTGTDGRPKLESKDSTQLVIGGVQPTLPVFPEQAVRDALREHALMGKNWFARLIGRNLSVRRTTQKDSVDEIMALIERGDIKDALNRMNALPSSVRSVAKDWMQAARKLS